MTDQINLVLILTRELFCGKINSCTYVYTELLSFFFLPQEKIINEPKNLTRNSGRNNAADMLYSK